MWHSLQGILADIQRQVGELWGILDQIGIFGGRWWSLACVNARLNTFLKCWVYWDRQDRKWWMKRGWRCEGGCCFNLGFGNAGGVRGEWEGWSLITSQNGPPLIHSPMCEPVPYLIVHWETSVHYTLITPSSTCKYNSCTEESSAIDVWINNEVNRNQAVGCKSFQPWSLVLASLNKCRSWPWKPPEGKERDRVLDIDRDKTKLSPGQCF